MVPYAWEFFYKFQVTDNISVTPAITYLSKPSFSGLQWHERHERSDQDPVQVLILGLRPLRGLIPFRFFSSPLQVGSFLCGLQRSEEWS